MSGDQNHSTNSDLAQKIVFDIKDMKMLLVLDNIEEPFVNDSDNFK